MGIFSASGQSGDFDMFAADFARNASEVRECRHDVQRCLERGGRSNKGEGEAQEDEHVVTACLLSKGRSLPEPNCGNQICNGCRRLEVVDTSAQVRTAGSK
jgi:hypothetical protein